MTADTPGAPPFAPFSRALAAVFDGLVAPAYGRPGFVARRATWDPQALDVDLRGRTYLVTGASTGLGLATATGLCARGATVHIVGRDATRGEQALATLRAVAGPSPVDRVHLHLADLALLREVRGLAARIDGAVARLDGLVNNAGVLLNQREETSEGLERTFATNVLSPFLLTHLLVPKLARAAPARVVVVSSGGMYSQRLDVDDLQQRKAPYDGVRAYAQAKRAEVLLTERAAACLSQRGIIAQAMHPGWADTPGVRTSLPRFHELTRRFLRSSEEGADTILWLLLAPEALAGPGRFWFDRMARRAHLPLLRTRSSAADVELLWQECHRLCGLPHPEEQGAPTPPPDL